MKHEKIVKSYDPEIMKNIFKFIRPYKKIVVIAIIGLLLATGAELLLPVVMQKTIDNYILNDYIKVPDSEKIIIKDNIKKQIISINNELYILDKNKKKLLKQSNLSIDDFELYYIFSKPKDPAIYKVINNHDIFISGNKYITVKKNDLKKLSKNEQKLIKKADIQMLNVMSLIFLALLFCVLIFTFLQIYLMANTGQYVMRDIRMKMLSHITRQSVSFFNNRPIGSIVSRITSDVETINELFATIATSLLKDICLMIGVMITMVYLNYKLALIVFLSMPLVIILAIFFKKKARQVYRRVRKWISEINAFLSEHISGMHIVQIFARESISKKEFVEKSDGLLKANLSEMYLLAIFRPLVNLFASVSIGVIIFFGAGMHLNNIVSLGILIAFLNLVSKFYEPIRDISEKFTILQSAMAGGERAFDVLKHNEVIKDVKIDSQNKKIVGNIVFKNVFFSYKENIPIIKDFSLEINQGEKIAIVGYTGAGKTTIANLLTRFWDINSGRIIIDGVDIKKYSLKHLRKNIIPVQQDVLLFSGTVEDSIKMGSNISLEKIKESAKMVLAHDFISKLPEGYKTILNENATNISTGQRQLLSFARVIAHDPSIVILDEATSNIDTETETKIQIALKRLLKNRTSLIIAHRLSTIKNSDRIIVMNNGMVIEQGTHDILIRKKGIYYNLYKLQFSQIKK